MVVADAMAADAVAAAADAVFTTAADVTATVAAVTAAAVAAAVATAAVATAAVAEVAAALKPFVTAPCQLFLGNYYDGLTFPDHDELKIIPEKDKCKSYILGFLHC